MTALPWVIAIDNGSTGAVAVLDPSGELQGLHDIPVRVRDEQAASDHPLLARRQSRKDRDKAKGKKELDRAAACALLKKWLEQTGDAVLAVIEEPQIIVSRPGDPRPTSAQAVARSNLSAGIWIGMATALGVDVLQVPPKAWQRHLVPFASGEKLKEASVVEAARRFPRLKELLVGPRGGLKDGRSDAVLLAVYARERRKRELLLGEVAG